MSKHLIDEQHRKRIDDAVAAKFNQYGITGGVAEFMRTYVAERVFRDVQTGELMLNTPKPVHAVRDGWNSGEWALANPEPLPLDEGLARIFDADGPFAVLAKRQRQLLIEKWDQQIQHTMFMRELHERNARNAAEQVRASAWQALRPNERAIARLAHTKKGEPVKYDELQAAIARESSEDSSPPDGWTPPPEVPKKKSFMSDWPNLTVDPSKIGEHNAPNGKRVRPDEHNAPNGKRVRPDGAGGKITTWVGDSDGDDVEAEQ